MLLGEACVEGELLFLPWLFGCLAFDFPSTTLLFWYPIFPFSTQGKESAANKDLKIENKNKFLSCKLIMRVGLEQKQI